MAEVMASANAIKRRKESRLMAHHQGCKKAKTK
jgi:hypothetical protein